MDSTLNLRMFTFFPTILALKMAEIAIFMVMLKVMTNIMALVMVNGFYTKGVDCFSLLCQIKTDL